MAQAAGPVPTGKEIERAEAFTLERFVHPGEAVEVALAPGTPRARALWSALEELDEGAKLPSTKWRRAWSLLLGLERVLSEEEPHLADGTVLNPHQVDALSGTLTALLAARMKTDDLEIAEPVFDVGEQPLEEIAPDDEELAAELAALDEEHAEDEDEEGDEEIEEIEVEVDQRHWCSV